MPLMVLAIFALLMVQMQSFSRVAMVVLTAPLGLIGVSAALLVTGAPFGFVATLGFIALAGIIMRNSVILVDQIEHDLREGAARPGAVRTVLEAVTALHPRRIRGAPAGVPGRGHRVLLESADPVPRAPVGGAATSAAEEAFRHTCPGLRRPFAHAGEG